MTKAKNVILVGSTSVLAEYFYASCIHQYNFVNICRFNRSKNPSANCIDFDFSAEFNRDLFDDLLSSIRSSLVDSLETVLCLFAWAGTPRSSSDPASRLSIEHNNNIIISNFTFLAKSICPSQIFFLSSAGGLYDGSLNTIHTESSAPLPASPYGIQKLTAESLFASLAHDLSVPICIYRISCAYGLNTRFPDQGVLNKWLFDGLVNGEINIYNDLSSELNFISYDQISVAIEMGIDQDLNGIFNLGSCQSTSLSDIYRSVMELVPSIRSHHIDNSVRFLNIDCTKFEQATGCIFEPLICHDAIKIFTKIRESLMFK